MSIVTNVARLSMDLKVGGGVATGRAFVGNVGSGEVKDFTVLGDVVNVAARLQGEAAPGEIIVENRTYQRVKSRYKSARERNFQLKGKANPISASVLKTVA